MNYQIEKNIPHPQLDKVKYPFKDMEIGDSFYVPTEGADVVTIKDRLYSAMRDNRLRLGFKFSMRRFNDGFRIWRIS